MFQITEDPSSESLVQCLVKNYKNDSFLLYNCNTIKIIKYFKMFQHVSDYRGSIIREPCTVLG